MPLYLENYYIVRPDDHFMTSYMVMDNGTVITLTYTFYSWPVLFPNLINILDMIVQLAAIHFVWTGKMFRKTKFFMLLLIFSTTISWRSFTFIICTTLASSIGTGVIYRITTYISLYTDAITDYFSMQMIFLMSLNRCLSFTRDTWNSRIFGGSRYILTVIGSGVLSIISAISGLITSKVYRHFNYQYGFVDYGYSVGIRAEISRLYYTFQISSVFCYAILYYYLRKQNKSISNQSANTNQGEKKVFVQLCVAVVLEVTLSIFYECNLLLARLDRSQKTSGFGNDTLQDTAMGILNVTNYFPEISLPFLMLISHYRVRERILNFISPSGSTVVVGRRVMETRV